MTMEQRMDQLEKRNKRLTVALTMTARRIFVVNDAGGLAVGLNTNDHGNGTFYTLSAKGSKLVQLSSTADGDGTVTTWNRKGKGRTLQPGP